VLVKRKKRERQRIKTRWVLASVVCDGCGREITDSICMRAMGDTVIER
jgi:hypothetical protein